MSQQPTLLCVLDHPTQYDPPLWREMTTRGNLKPVVWYGLPAAPRDAELARSVEWLDSLASDYEARVVPDNVLRAELAKLAGAPPAAVLTAGWTRPRTWTCVRFARRHGVPVVFPSDSIPRAPLPPHRAAAKAAVQVLKNRAAMGFFTTGALGVDYLTRCGVKPDAIATGVYPADTAYWERAAREQAGEGTRLRAALGAGDGDFVVLAVCKHHPRENPGVLLDAFALLRRDVPGAKLLLVGDGPLRGELEQKAAALGIADTTRFCGYVPYRELPAYYAAADVFVHVPPEEIWGVSPGEAMACGVPVVAGTHVGAAADLIVEGVTGHTADGSDPAAIADALRRVSARPRGEWRAACLARVGRALGLAEVSARLEALVGRLAARPRACDGLLRSLFRGYRGFRRGDAVRLAPRAA